MTPPPIKQIRFSEIMIRALLREIEKPGTGKTQERLVLKPQLVCKSHALWPKHPDTRPRVDELGLYCGVCGAGVELDHRRKEGVRHIPVPYAVGDLLWVRETWQGINTPDGPQLTYRATPDYFVIDAWDGPDEGAGPSFNYDRCPGTDFCNWGADVLNDDGPWRPSVHMPSWASRLTLEVTGVKVERLQNISEEDALAEGIFEFEGVGCYGYDKRGTPGLHAMDTARDTFACLWNRLNQARGFDWDMNPWVVAVTFRPHKANIETLLSQREAA